MRINVRNYRITNDKYGYLVQRAVGRQWKDPQYCSDLGHVSTYLFERILERSTKELDIDLDNLDEARGQLLELASLVQKAKNEIREALREHGL